MSQQLLYGVKSPEIFNFDNFYPRGNELVVRTLRESLQNENHGFYFLWGASATGRSHLLQAICHLAASLDLQASYIPLKIFKDYNTEILDSLELLDVICIDDIDEIVGDKVWEESLFHLYNRVQGAHTKLYVTAQSAPRLLQINLPDLLSRLCAGLCFQLAHPTDEDKIEILKHHALSRHMLINPTVLHYLLNQYSRDLNDLCLLLVTLDEKSLETGRAITIPFVKQQLELS
jgi:DnaA-homolog protein